MKINEILQFSEAFLSHTEEDDSYMRGMMERFYEISLGRNLVPVTKIGGIDVVSSQWPPEKRSYVFFLDRGQLVGWAKVQQGGRDATDYEDERFAVMTIWLEPQYRRQGIGRAFYDLLQQTVRLKPDVKQTEAGAALWRSRRPAMLEGAGLTISKTRIELL